MKKKALHGLLLMSILGLSVWAATENYLLAIPFQESDLVGVDRVIRHLLLSDGRVLCAFLITFGSSAWLGWQVFRFRQWSDFEILVVPLYFISSYFRPLLAYTIWVGNGYHFHWTSADAFLQDPVLKYGHLVLMVLWLILVLVIHVRLKRSAARSR